MVDERIRWTKRSKAGGIIWAKREYDKHLARKQQNIVGTRGIMVAFLDVARASSIYLGALYSRLAAALWLAPCLPSASLCGISPHRREQAHHSLSRSGITANSAFPSTIYRAGQQNYEPRLRDRHATYTAFLCSDTPATYRLLALPFGVIHPVLAAVAPDVTAYNDHRLSRSAIFPSSLPVGVAFSCRYRAITRTACISRIAPARC